MSSPVPRIFLNNGSPQSSRLLFAPRKPPPVPYYMGYNTGYRFPMYAPERDPNYVFFGNRNDFSGDWHYKGDPNPYEEGSVFTPEHHNQHLSAETRMNEQDLTQQLGRLGIQGDGDRENQFKQLINVSENPDLRGRLLQGERPNPEELRTIVNRHKLSPTEEAEITRRERLGQVAPQQNQPNQSWWQQSRVNPRNWQSQQNPIMRADGAPVSNVEAQGIRQWGEQNLAQRLPQQAMGTGMPGANAARLGAAEGAAAGQLGGAAAAGGAAVGGMSRAATFATRTLPVLNLALLAGSLVQASNQNRRQKQSEEQYNRMRV